VKFIVLLKEEYVALFAVITEIIKNYLLSGPDRQEVYKVSTSHPGIHKYLHDQNLVK